MNGNVYRLCPIDATQLVQLVATIVGLPCWSFGGAVLWDFDPAKGTANLRSIEELRKPEDLDLRGDFGHIFSARAEVRWKRLSATDYDVLVLSEMPQQIEGAQTIGSEWITVQSAHTDVAIRQTGGRQPLTCIAYHAPNGAVQFLRYTGVKS